MVLYLCALPPKRPEPRFNHDKNIRQIPVAAQSVKQPTSPAQNGQGQQNKGSLRPGHRHRGAQDKKRMEHNVAPWRKSCDRKGHQGETKEM